MSLSVSGLVRVTVNLSPLAAAVRSFGVLMIAGDSTVISGLERFRTYLTIEGVAADFGVTAPEYKAAALYFGQVPKPRTLMIGRWIRVASPAENIGGILSTADQLLANFTAISSGGMIIVIDGVTKTLSGLNFTGVTNLNGVAAIIDTALLGGSCVWDGEEFVISSDTTGAGAKATGTISLDTNPSYGVQASGTITLSGQPANGDTVTIKSTVVTFVTGTPTGNQVQIGADATATAAALQAFLQASADANLAANTYGTIALVTTITARVYGTAGNAYGLLKSGTNISVSGATLAGGVAADTLTVNGTAITFVATAPTGSQVLVAPTAAQTAGNLQTFLAASVDANIALATYSTVGTLTTVTYSATGTAGNAFTLVKSSSHITISGAVLAGGAVASSVGYATQGAGTDLSVTLKLSASFSQALVPGYAAETPVQCAAVLSDMSAAWYGLMFGASAQPGISDNTAVADFIEALDLKRIFGITGQSSSILSALVTTDIASVLMAGGYRQTFIQYSSVQPYAIASFFGRAFSVNFAANRSTITLMFKQEPGVVGENLTENQALTLTNKRCNVFVDYVNDTMIIQHGVMSGPAFFDEIHGLDWLQNQIQTNCYNVLYQSKTKIPQTDAGVNQLVNAISAACDQAVNNGLVAPGVWNADGFGNLETGQYLKTGYYIYAQPVALQSQSDREARVAPPIQVAVKLAGAIQSMDVIVDVNR